MSLTHELASIEVAQSLSFLVWNPPSLTLPQ